MNAQDRAIASGRRLIEQKVGRRDLANAALTEAQEAFHEAGRALDVEQIRVAGQLTQNLNLAAQRMQKASDQLSHDETLVDAAFAEYYQDCLAIAKAELAVPEAPGVPHSVRRIP